MSAYTVLHTSNLTRGRFCAGECQCGPLALQLLALALPVILIEYKQIKKSLDESGVTSSGTQRVSWRSSALCSSREELFELAAPGSLLHVVIPAEMLPIDKDVWHGTLTGDTLEGGLYLGAVCKLVELDVRGINAHLLEETLGPANSSTRDRVRCGAVQSEPWMH